MDEQIKNHLLEYLDKTAGAVEKLLDFSADQIPLVAKEILTYNIWSSSFSILVMGAMLYKLYVTMRDLFIAEYKRVEDLKTNKAGKDRCYPSYETEFSSMIGVIIFVSGLVGFVVLLHFFHTVDHLIKVVLAPRLFLLDYLRGLK